MATPIGMKQLPNDYWKTAKKSLIAGLIAAVGVLIPWLLTKQEELAWAVPPVIILTAIRDIFKPHYTPVDTFGDPEPPPTP